MVFRFSFKITQVMWKPNPLCFNPEKTKMWCFTLNLTCQDKVDIGQYYFFLHLSQKSFPDNPKTNCEETVLKFEHSFVLAGLPLHSLKTICRLHALFIQVHAACHTAYSYGSEICRRMIISDQITICLNCDESFSLSLAMSRELHLQCHLFGRQKYK